MLSVLTSTAPVRFSGWFPGFRAPAARTSPGEDEPSAPRAAHARVADDAAKPQVAGRGVDRLALAGGGPVAQAVARRAQMRAALDDPARNAGPRLPGDPAVLGRGRPRVARDAAGVAGVGRVPRREVVAGPLPD